VVEAASTRILIDAGVGPRVLANRLGAAGVEPGSVQAILLSHGHADHVHGAARFSKRWGVRVEASTGTLEEARISRDDVSELRVLYPERERHIGPLRITAVQTPHDSRAPMAFLVGLADEAGEQLAFVTDLGHMPEDLAARLRGCRALVLESNHDITMLRDGPYPWRLKERILGVAGHLSNAQAARFLRRDLGPECRTVILAHLSRTNNHPEVARMEAERALAQAGRSDVELHVARPEGTDWIELGRPEKEPVAASAQLTLW
jgi:phosphoribosyl 1,2-cyclic phosphodiesterase